MICDECGDGAHLRRYVASVLKQETAKARSEGIGVGVAIGFGLSALVAAIAYAWRAL